MIAAIQTALFLLASILIGALAVIISNIHIAGWAKRAPKEKKNWIGFLQTIVMLIGVVPSFYLMLRAGMIVQINLGIPAIFLVMLVWFFGLIGSAFLYERNVYNPKFVDRNRA